VTRRRSGDAYLVDKSFLDGVESSLTVLERPDAAQLLDGSHAARGNNVQELVESMTGQGLQFARSRLAPNPRTSLYATRSCPMPAPRSRPASTP
jgi:hypothetical protein